MNRSGHAFGGTNSDRVPSLFGPRHCGQSAALVWPPTELQRPIARSAAAPVLSVIGVAIALWYRAMDVVRARQHSIGDLPRRTAARYPDKLAVRFAETTWTYREFDEICNRLANGLIERGLAAGDRVAILSRNSHAFAALRFALARAGGVLVPINFMLNAQEIAYILRSSGARALAVSDEFLDTGSKAAALDTSVSQALRLSAFDGLLEPRHAPAGDPGRRATGSRKSSTPAAPNRCPRARC